MPPTHDIVALINNLSKMKKVTSTPAAENLTANNAKVNPLANAVKKVEANKAKTVKTAAVKADAKPAKKESKVKKVTMASKLDEILLAGGKWEDLVTKAEASSKVLGGHIKYNVGILKAHIRFRTIIQKNLQYLGDKRVSETGIGIATKKASNKKAA